jgi:hypothetical protein
VLRILNFSISNVFLSVKGKDNIHNVEDNTTKARLQPERSLHIKRSNKIIALFCKAQKHYTVGTPLKKLFDIPSPAGMSLTKLSLGGNYDVIYKLFLPRESLVGDIPAGDRNI